jgi:hypothetical protein
VHAIEDIFMAFQHMPKIQLDRRFAGSNPAEGDGILMAVEIRSTTSFGEEVKPPAPHRKISRHVKIPFEV